MLRDAIRPARRGLASSVAGPSRLPACSEIGVARPQSNSRRYATRPQLTRKRDIDETSRPTRAGKDRNVIQIINMSPSATENDVRSLVYRAAASSGTGLDASLASQPEPGYDPRSLDLGRQIVDITFPRDKFLRRQDRVHITMKQPEQAQRLEELLTGKAFGGAILGMQKHPEKYKVPDTKELQVLALMKAASPGRVVIMRGMPTHLTSQRMLNLLKRDYALGADIGVSKLRTGKNGNAGDALDGRAMLHAVEEVTINDISRTFLIRFETVSDAMRYVRKWNGSVWRSAPREEPLSKDEAEDDEAEHEASEGDGDETVAASAAAEEEPPIYRDPNLDPRLYEPGVRLTPFAASKIRRDFTQVSNILDASLCS